MYIYILRNPEKKLFNISSQDLEYKKLYYKTIEQDY